MGFIDKTLQKIDRFQRHHPLIGFPYAVVKKYGEDETGYQAALLTYYGFLSLFPLLLVLTTFLTIIAGSHPHLRQSIIGSTAAYFPILGNQLSEHVYSLHKSGLALIVGLLFTLYGARGVADAFIHGVNHIWRIPKNERAGFPLSMVKSLAVMLIGGTGFIAAAIITTYAAAAGRGLVFQGFSIFINLVILFWLFLFLINVSLPRNVSLKDISVGAAIAAIGLVVLQNVGGYVLAHQLKSLDALYSNFAIVLGLLFWIYLQSQMVYYAVEVAAVRSKRLWPRGLSGEDSQINQ
ncbi:MAG TPA: YihY/virulence factor BrkB family protein [Candidatus Saccharimonadales bacterium]|nr:YihY/virulence factor BrkB family protein [Candidatus Saccharimonadales bacterium]